MDRYCSIHTKNNGFKDLVYENLLMFFPSVKILKIFSLSLDTCMCNRFFFLNSNNSTAASPLNLWPATCY